ncbi:MAG: WG repeat-containing protein [Croceitalea sp.]|nr:WG repeat-containing protein [Croceitalea sp.]MBT8238373.1 WG repeat-containing protein [Croceitalea sp.]NNC34018.1 WG repeat-containing protein [Croceitalea sp.]NNL09431.1 WG repeat-containing protein [Croceitalea sp.]NNM17342.1 WG repeat-containing protein [Croceitalea sp.]
MRTTTLLLFVLSFTILNAQLPKDLDEVAPFSEGLAAIKKGNQWAFINDLGAIVIDFRDDIHWNKNPQSNVNDIRSVGYPMFSDGLCIVEKFVDDIAIYGFIDTEGKLVIEHQFLNVRPFENGFTTGIVFEKVFRGYNEFKFKIFEYKFHEVVMDTSGNIVEFLERRYNIQMKKSRYHLPPIASRLLNDKLIAVKAAENWELRKVNF